MKRATAGWFLGMLVGMALSLAATAALHPGAVASFLIGMVLGAGCSMTGAMVAMLSEPNR